MFTSFTMAFPAAASGSSSADMAPASNSHIEFEEDVEIGSEIEDMVEDLCWNVENNGDDEEEEEPAMPASLTKDQTCYSPLVGSHHQRRVVLPDGLFGGPSLEAASSCNNPECPCQTEATSDSPDLPYDTPLRFFKLFFTPLVFTTLATNTNLYAAEKHKGASGRAWWPCSAAELKIWIGMIIYISVFGTGRPDELWMKNRNFPQHWQCLSSAGSRLSDTFTNGTLPASRFFEKLEPIATMLQESFQRAVVVATNVAIDECMIRFTGRSKHTVMIRGKPVPVGYYILALCEAGYMFAFSFKGAAGFSGPYLQSVLNKRLPRPILSPTHTTMLNQLSATSKAVLSLMLQLPADRFFHLFCDNLFSTTDLFHILRQFGIAACGTARSNRRNWPLELRKINRKKDHLLFNSKVVRIVHGDVAAIVWQSNNLVQFITTGHELDETEAVERRRPQARDKWMKETVERVWGSSSSAILQLPKWSVDYNNHMGAVDRHDQLRSYHPTQIKALRNWLALFFFLLDAAVINAYLLCKESQRSNPRDPIMKHRQFRVRLAWNLIIEGQREMQQTSASERTQPQQRRAPTGNTTASRARGYVTANFQLPAVRFMAANHERKGHYPRPNLCVYCRWLRKVRTQNAKVCRTSLYCLVCGPAFPLCASCFPQWHSH